MFKTINHLLSLIRFSHTIFALPFALLAALMAWRLDAIEMSMEEVLQQGTNFFGQWWTDLEDGRRIYHITPEWVRNIVAISGKELVGILLCMVTARSAAMAFNRLADREIDAGNPRTEGRHLPAGILSVGQVWGFTIVCSLGFVASTLLFLPNRLPLYLSVPVLLFLCGYSYTKRFTSLAHFWLGGALAMSPVAAWIAIRGEVVIENLADLLPALVLGGAVLTWVAGFDMIYACQDFEFDRETKLRSIPSRLGIPGALRLAACCHAVTVVLLALLPTVYPPFGLLYGWLRWVWWRFCWFTSIGWCDRTI